MKIIYITKARLPTEKAYGTNMVKTCEALAKAGAEVTIIAPQTGNKTARNDIFSYYAIKKIFSVRQLPILDAISMGWHGGFWVNHLSFFAAVLMQHLGGKRESVILARDELAALILRLKGYRVFYDMHGFPEKKRWFWKLAMSRMTGIIVTNHWKVVQCRDIFGIPEKQTMVAPNGFDPVLFTVAKKKDTLREELGLPHDARIVLYSGHLYDWKGASVVLEAARDFQCSASNFPTLFIFVGGTGKDLEDFKEKARELKNVRVLGFRPYAEIPRYLKAADVLVLPNSQFSKNPRFAVYSQHDTSPIKLFEYMASGTPIVASMLPSICEILNTENATLVKPDNPRALREGIERVLRDPTFSARLAFRAAEDSKKYTWEKRGERILTFIKTRV